ncbi:unnamed protein product, partial [Rotaria socialis]
MALEVENGMSSSERKSDVNKYWVDIQGERYLQVEDVTYALGYLKEDEADKESVVEEQTELMYKENTIWTAIFNADKVAIDELIHRDPNVVDTRGAVG